MMNGVVNKRSDTIVSWVWLIVLAFVICNSSLSPVRAQVGTWKNHLAYHEVQSICKAGDYLFVLASNDLYQYNLNDQSITTYDKVSGLSDTHITRIAWNQQAKRLIAVYENANIDLIETDGDVINIPALYSKPMTDDKTVKSISIDGVYAYLNCGFGIVKVNMQKAEITETYTPNHPEYPTNLTDYQDDYDEYISLVSTLLPDGPAYNLFYESTVCNDKLYTTGGYFLSGVSQMDNPGVIQVYDGNGWTLYEENINEKTGYEYKDMNCIAVDPTDNSHVFAGGRCGLYEYRNGQLLKYYNKDNSPLGGAIDNGKELGNNYVIVNGIIFDAEGNLWVLNSQAQGKSFLKLSKEGQWTDYTKETLLDNKGVGLNGLRSMMIDSRQYLWFVNTSWLDPAVFCYHIANDELIKYNNFINQDGVRYSPTYVTSVCEDKEHNIWVGTDLGPFMIQSQEAGQQQITFQQVKVPRNDGSDYADYLLSGVYVNHIAVDGANQKWFATSGAGAFNISADNLTQIHAFTKDNSYLLSDDIYSIAVSQKTGEIYFLTSKGLCSYMSDTSESSEEMTKDNVWAYPNPVTPDYTGLITVTGLSYNADVKITASNGALIAEGRSNGGTFTWNGCDRQGRRVASGVYMVITATSDGKKGTVCKIAVIN